MDTVIVDVAKYGLAISLLGGMFVFARTKGWGRWQFVATLLLGGVFSYALAKLGAQLFYDPRPFVIDGVAPLMKHAADNGFPSDHTLLAAVLAWACLLYSRSVGVVLLLTMFAIGFARIAAGVHHPLDIAGSIVMAALGCFVAWLLVQKVLPGRSRTDVPV